MRACVRTSSEGRDGHRKEEQSCRQQADKCELELKSASRLSNAKEKPNNAKQNAVAIIRALSVLQRLTSFPFLHVGATPKNDWTAQAVYVLRMQWGTEKFDDYTQPPSA